jgi:hypothetical protein
MTTKINKKTIPDSLIIYIKTRIPNYYKLTYDPKMSIPTTKSHTVYFDPLVKYYSDEVKNLPSKDLIISQFFEKGQFESMINRILSSFKHMQRVRTLEEATDEGIIDNNIRITLNTLFKNNNILEIGKQPYTIVSSNWNAGDWKIDEKPIEKLITPYSYLPSYQTQTNISPTEEEWSSIPEIVRQGNAASMSILKDNNNNNINNNNTVKTSSVSDTSKTKMASKVISPETLISPTTSEYKPLITDQKILKSMPETYKKLYNKFLQNNIPINYTENIDIVKDPLTLSLLVDEKMLTDYAEKNINSEVIKVYNIYTVTKDKIIYIENKYLENVSTLGASKKNLNDYFIEVKPILEQYKKNTTSLSKKDISTLNNIMKNIRDYKVAYMKQLFSIIEILKELYALQKRYFTDLLNLLVEIKKEYAKIIEYNREPELAIKCIDCDINVFKSLVEEDQNNPYSKSYFDNFNRILQFYTTLTNIKDEILNPQLNYKDELDKYILNPNILSIEQAQYELYSYKVFLYYSYNQMDIWNNYYNSIELFTKQISIYSTEILNKSQTLLLQYNTNYTEQQQNDFMNNTNTNINTNVNNTNNNNLGQEKEYIELIQSQSDAYDCVILYIYLLEIQCLRQSKLYVAEENTNQLNIEFSTSLKNYYNSIEKTINENKNSNTLQNISLIIPKSLLWDTSRLTDLNYLNSRIELNNKSWVIYKNRITEIHRQQEELEEECDKIIQTINPTISKDGFINQCNNLFTSNYQFITPYTSKSSYWLKMQITNYDIIHTNELIYNLTNIIQDTYYDGIIKTNKPSGFQDWLVYDNIGGGDCLFASLVEALNGQLDLLDASTSNMYTEEVNGRKLYTVSSLRKLVADHFPQDVYELYCLVMPNSSTDASNNCLFDANAIDFSLLPDDLRGIYNLLVDENKQVRTIEEVKKLISTDCSKLKGSCYWADHIAINILQNVLKIKFIIFNMTPRLTNNIYEGDRIIYKNDEYRVKDISRKKQYDVSGAYIGESPIYIIENDVGDVVQNVQETYIEAIPEDTRHKLRIECTSTEEPINFEDFVYILRVNISSDPNNPVYHYEFVRNMATKNFILKFDDIPEYIQYFIYDNCYRYAKLNARQNTGFSTISKFADKFLLFDKQHDEERQNLKTQIELEEAESVRDQLLQEELQTNEDYALLQADPNSSQLEIDKMRDKLDKIKKQLTNIIKKIDILEGSNNTNTNKIIGGQIPSSYQQPIIIQQFNTNLPITTDVPKKDESKFSYYIGIELELFPGTSINSIQKSSVKCQSRFEKIREAYADLFGYEYRPGVISEAYAYQSMPKQDETSNSTSIDTKLSGGRKNKSKKCKKVSKKRSSKNKK